MKLGSHKNWISGIAHSPKVSYHIATSSYDGSAKVWDIRSSTSLYSVTQTEQKLLAIDWKKTYLTTGGEDGKLQIFSA